MKILIVFLLGLIFLSKISLAFIPGFPYQASFLIFQYGMHPFVNLFFNLLLGIILFFIFLNSKNHIHHQQKIYKFYLFLFGAYLVTITIIQALLLDSESSQLMQLLSSFSACLTIYLYGRIIPAELDVKIFFNTIKRISIFLCWISLIALVVSPGSSFKGGRFIGVLKHIPYMVTLSTIACTTLIYDLIYLNESRLRKILALVCFFVAFFLLILTGTRSALFAVLLSYFLAVLFFPAKKPTTQFLKVSLATTILLSSLLFGVQIIDYTIGVVRGENSIGLRAAQDGVSSRMEEVERGLEIFNKNPILGQGLLSKFGDINESDVGHYNANKDPHNILVSAGVIGGIGFVVIIAVGLLGLLLMCKTTIRSPSPEIKILTLYIVTQIPILVIYHVHLSLGGMADRLYWIIIGYVMTISHNKLANSVNRES